MKCIQNNLKELVYEGHIVPGYYINKEGELFTTRRAGLNRFSDPSIENICYGGPMVKREGTKRGNYILYRLSKLHTHRQYDNITQRYFGICSHRALMETFKPIEDNLPEDLVDEWDNLSDVVKKYIKKSFVVDHIDSDTNKDTYHHLSNLQWLTLSDNSKKGNR